MHNHQTNNIVENTKEKCLTEFMTVYNIIYFVEPQKKKSLTKLVYSHILQVGIAVY